jgi:hypothetical protein
MMVEVEGSRQEMDENASGDAKETGLERVEKERELGMQNVWCQCRCHREWKPGLVGFCQRKRGLGVN